MSSLKKQIPNLVTWFRFFIIPAIIWLVVMERNNYLAVSLILLGAASDILDGALARKWELSSLFGYFLDHLVDKLYLATLLYVAFRHLNVYLLISVFSLEGLTIIFSLLFFRKRIREEKETEDWPNIWGKASYGFLIGSTSAALLGANGSLLWKTSFICLGNSSLVAAILLRIVSFLQGINSFFQVKQKLDSDNQ
jgi:phosphatidylglycerophosphate synthase